MVFLTTSESQRGGGVFLGDRLVGIIATHSHPLWPAELLSSKGEPLDPGLNARLEQVSLGVSSTTIQQQFQELVEPTARELNGLENLICAPLPPPSPQR
jgi:hypothetical protein